MHNTNEAMIRSMGWEVHSFRRPHFVKLISQLGTAEKCVGKWEVYCTRGNQKILARAWSKDKAFQLAADMVEQLDEFGFWS